MSSTADLCVNDVAEGGSTGGQSKPVGVMNYKHKLIDHLLCLYLLNGIITIAARGRWDRAMATGAEPNPNRNVTSV